MTVRVFDFFSGCGGTSCGFAQAGLQIALGLDIDADSAETYKNNFPDADFIQADIKSLDTSVLAPYLEGIATPILFCGCAPCQPFSRQNRSKEKGDKRLNLLAEFGRFIRAWLPDYVFIENVPGMQRLSETEGPFPAFLSMLSELGYNHDSGTLPALWFGVPQTRERLVLLASRRGPIELPVPTHGPGRINPDFSNVIDWISGFPPIAAGETSPEDPDHCSAGLSPTNLKRISMTPEGGGRRDWPASLWLDCHKGHRGHSDVYGRLRWKAPASGLTTKCISYSNGRFGHPDQDRALSVREAACLQTFPRNYHFVGNLGSKARQIGNAVPPLMAQRVGEHILRHSGQEGHTNIDGTWPDTRTLILE